MPVLIIDPLVTSFRNPLSHDIAGETNTGKASESINLQDHHRCSINATTLDPKASFRRRIDFRGHLKSRHQLVDSLVNLKACCRSKAPAFFKTKDDNTTISISKG